MKTHTSDPVCPGCALKLDSADFRLRDWFLKEVKPNFKDAHISWAFRDKVDQQQAFDNGKTCLEWPNSAHNHMNNAVPCARALDLFQVNDDHPTGCWEPKWFYLINAHNEQNGIQLKWGGKFQTLGDSDHFELIN